MSILRKVLLVVLGVSYLLSKYIQWIWLSSLILFIFSLITHSFWATICKIVRPMLSDHCPILSVCNIAVFLPNGWMHCVAARVRSWSDLLRRKPVRMAKAFACLPAREVVALVGAYRFRRAATFCRRNLEFFMIICSDTTGRLVAGTRTRN